MPFIGVLPERAPLFKPQPQRSIAVSDAAAWRLNPAHRQVYDKLSLALAAGLRAAPCGVDPADYGIDPQELVFVKPIINLAGMSRGARALRAAEVPLEPGSFWCERLSGVHTSSDALVRDGEALWFAHSQASLERDAERALYWDIGATLPQIEPILHAWIGRLLIGYTGLCNIELIDGRPIEIHLRGSNGFFDFYGSGFIPAWVALVDGDASTTPPSIPGGVVISVFGSGTLDPIQRQRIEALGVAVDPDPHSPERIAILRAPRDRERLRALAEMLDAFDDSAQALLRLAQNLRI